MTTTDDLRTRARQAWRWNVPAGGYRLKRDAFEAGYLAHAAEQPTREDIAIALHDYDLDGTACMSDEQECMEHYRRAADAVLALFDGAGS